MAKLCYKDFLNYAVRLLYGEKSHKRSRYDENYLNADCLLI